MSRHEIASLLFTLSKPKGSQRPVVESPPIFIEDDTRASKNQKPIPENSTLKQASIGYIIVIEV
jgi:hypothetical protein